MSIQNCLKTYQRNNLKFKNLNKKFLYDKSVQEILISLLKTVLLCRIYAFYCVIYFNFLFLNSELLLLVHSFLTRSTYCDIGNGAGPIHTKAPNRRREMFPRRAVKVDCLS